MSARIAPNAVSQIEVQNRTTCPAEVTLRVGNVNSRLLAIVPAGVTERLSVMGTASGGTVSAIALNLPERTLCDGLWNQRIGVRVLDAVASNSSN